MYNRCNTSGDKGLEETILYEGLIYNDTTVQLSDSIDNYLMLGLYTYYSGSNTTVRRVTILTNDFIELSFFPIARRTDEIAENRRVYTVPTDHTKIRIAGNYNNNSYTPVFKIVGINKTSVINTTTIGFGFPSYTVSTSGAVTYVDCGFEPTKILIKTGSYWTLWVDGTNLHSSNYSPKIVSTNSGGFSFKTRVGGNYTYDGFCISERYADQWSGLKGSVISYYQQASGQNIRVDCGFKPSQVAIICDSGFNYSSYYHNNSTDMTNSSYSPSITVDNTGYTFTTRTQVINDYTCFCIN